MRAVTRETEMAFNQSAAMAPTGFSNDVYKDFVNAPSAEFILDQDNTNAPKQDQNDGAVKADQNKSAHMEVVADSILDMVAPGLGVASQLGTSAAQAYGDVRSEEAQMKQAAEMQNLLTAPMPQNRNFNQFKQANDAPFLGYDAKDLKAAPSAFQPTERPSDSDMQYTRNMTIDMNLSVQKMAQQMRLAA